MHREFAILFHRKIFTMMKSGADRFSYKRSLPRGAYSSLGGFTLVEMLIVVAIIGILAAVAIPQFASYRQKSYCARVKSDLANLAISQEAYYYDHNSYLAVTLGAGGVSNVPNFYWSEGVTLTSSTGDTTGWTAVADHPNCSIGPFTWDSQNGGLQ